MGGPAVVEPGALVDPAAPGLGVRSAELEVLVVTFFDKPKVAGIEEYDLRWGLENILRVRHGHELRPAGPAGQALVWEFLAGHARRLYREAVLSMRSAGLGWWTIAEQLGRLEPGEEWESADRVFHSVAGENSWGNPVARFHCDSCSAWIEDYGPPGGSHPEDVEHGHQDGCERLAALVVAWAEASR